MTNLTGISHKQREYQFPLFDSASIGISITKRNRAVKKLAHGAAPFEISSAAQVWRRKSTY